MATTPQTSRHYVDFDEYIQHQLEKTRDGIRWTDLLTAVCGLGALVLAYLLIFIACDHWVVDGGFSDTTRLVAFGALLVVALAWLAWTLAVPYWRRVNSLYAARAIETAQPGLKSTLLSLVDLQRSGRAIPQDVRRALEKRAAVSLAHTDVDQAVDRHRLMQVAYTLLGLVILACLYTLFSPKPISGSITRALLPAADVPPPTRTEILQVEPGDKEVLARTQVEVVAHLGGEPADEVTLFYTTADRQFVDEPVPMRPVDETGNRYRCLLTGENGEGLLQNTQYSVHAGDARSREFQLTVTRPPTAEIEQVRYDYPEYMKLEPKTESFGHIDAWEGTKVTVEATANMPVVSARILFSDSDDTSVKAEEIPMDVSGGTKLTATWKLEFRSDGTYPRFYRIQCKNDAGRTHPDPTLYRVKIRRDRPPHIALLDPVRDLKRPANGIVPLLVEARDPDFRLRFITLRVQKDGEEIATRQIFDGHRESFRTTYDFKLEPLGLRAGETITYWIEARDNKQPLGNRSTTPRLNIEIAGETGEEQVQEQLRRDKQRQQELLDEARSQKNQEGGGEQSGEGSRKGEDAEQSGEGEKRQPDEQKTSGEKSGNKGEPQDKSDKSGAGDKSGSQKQGEDGQERYRPDGPDDDRVLRKLMEEYQKDQPKKDRQKPEPNEQQKQKPQPDAGEQQKQSKDQQEQKESQKDQSSQTDEKSEPMNGGERQSGNKQQSSGEQQSGEKEGDQSKASSDKGGQDNSGGTPMGEKQPSDGSAENSTPGDTKQGKDGGQGKGQQSDKPLQGKEQPAQDDGNAQPKQADGDETGTGTPEENPQTEPKPAQNPDQVKRKPGTEPATRDGDQKQSGGESSKRKTDGSGNPQAAKGKEPSPSDAANRAEKSPAPESKDSGKRSSPVRNQPDSANEELKGKGRPKGQHANEPRGGGERGSSQQKSQGDSGGDQRGAGDSSGKPGGAEPAKQPNTGRSGGQQGKGSQTRPGGEGGNRPSQGESSGDGEPPQGGGQGASGRSGDAPGQQGEQPGSGASSGQRAGSGGGSGTRGGPQSGPSGSGEGGRSTAPSPEEANLEYAREATDLTLKRLEDDLERGEVDQELLKELGWTEEQLARFTERMQRQLKARGEADTPRERARQRQFEEMLKSLNVRSSGSRRSGQEGGDSAAPGIGPRRLPVPPEYREAYEAYTKSLAKQKETE